MRVTLREVSGALPPNHPVVEVLRKEGPRAHGLVIRDCRQYGLWLGVNQDGVGRADLSDGRRLFLEVEVSV